MMRVTSKKHDIKCPNCGKKNFTDIRKFNLMFKTFQGVTEDAKNEIYLRPETAQGIFVNFANVQRTTRKKVPFGIGQIGKSFRNEITPGNFTFRTREFEQMELEFFCKPGTDLEWFCYWKDLLQKLAAVLRYQRRKYASSATTRKKNFPTTRTPPPTSSLCSPSAGVNSGALPTALTYDLTQHQTHSGKSTGIFRSCEANERYIPYVIEPSLGADRVALAFSAVRRYDDGRGQRRILKEQSCTCIPRWRPYKCRCPSPVEKAL